jgi:single-strand DNA-binding protein
MFHTIIVVGNLGRDPEMRYTPSGQAVTTFSVATNRTYTGNNGQQVKETIWFRVSAWGKQAETCNNYLKKGSKVLVEGRLQADPNSGGPRTFSRQDGTTASNFEVVASTIRFLTPRSGDDEGGSSYSSSGEDFAAPAGGDDEIPF